MARAPDAAAVADNTCQTPCHCHQLSGLHSGEPVRPARWAATASANTAPAPAYTRHRRRPVRSNANVYTTATARIGQSCAGCAHDGCGPW